MLQHSRHFVIFYFLTAGSYLFQESQEQLTDSLKISRCVVFERSFHGCPSEQKYCSSVYVVEAELQLITYSKKAGVRGSSQLRRCFAQLLLLFVQPKQSDEHQNCYT